MSSTYKTRSADTWDAIALRTLGSENYMVLMIAANPSYNYVARFDEGVELVVPDVPAADLPTSLPPWRIG